MSENKFIKKLKGEPTTKSLVELKNQNTPASFGNMPHGTSDPIVKYSDHRGNATVVAKGTQNWKLSGNSLILANTVNGDGNDYTDEYNVSGSGLWVNASYTFPLTGNPRLPVAEVFNADTKWVLKLCGYNLFSDNETLDLTLIVKIGTTNIVSKTFKIRRKALQFCEEFVIDYAESEQSVVKALGGSTLSVQLLCSDPTASATIYNGMTVLTALQRRVDAIDVASTQANLDDFMNGYIIPEDYFDNTSIIDQIEDGGDAYALFHRSGDNVDLSAWVPKEKVAYIEDVIVKSDTIPTASEDLVGAIYQYTGITASPYEHGYIYECKEISAGVYGWERIDVQPGGSRGRFLALWNCVTGLAESNPPISPYEYKTGDYFIVGTISTANPAINYKPDGLSYITGVASTTVETNEVAVDDTYFFDGTTWKLQSNSNKTVTFANIAGDIYDNSSATTALNAKQDTLVNQTNIKSVNGNSLVGSGNLELSTYLTYPNTWITNSTTKAFCDNIAADSSAIVGKAYLGEVTFSDLPSSMVNGEVVVEIMDGTTQLNKVIVLTLKSGNVSPYAWQYVYWNGGSNVSGWKTWQEPLVSGTNIKTINSTSLLGSGNIEVLQNEATPASSLGIGYTTINTTYTDSINIGNGAQVGANNALALGAFASAEGQDSIAIYSSTGTSHRARTTHTGNIAIGYNALAMNAPYTIAIGYNAFATGTNAIQLGTGQNSSTGVFQVWTYKLLNKTSGLIPSARFADQTSATQGQVLALDSNLDAQWTTISTMTGATAGDAGTSGLVPAPAAGDQAKFLQGDGTWANPTAATAWGNITGTLADQTDLNTALSGKADVATTLSGYGITDGANTDLSNLTATGKNIANWSSNVTNCVINDSQDIKLELNPATGTLTLKAGSKTYVPNGVDTFDELVLANDLTYGPEGSATQYDLLYIRSDSSRLDFHNNNTSGTTAPTGSGFFWNTNTNTIKYYNSGTETNIQESIPIARIHRTNGSWDYIDQIFNGVGYMGSTIFELPKHKGLAPNGKNSDGLLENILVSTNQVRTFTWSTTTGIGIMAINNAGVYGVGLDSWNYNEDTNYFERASDGAKSYHYEAARCVLNNGVITKFNKKCVFSAFDYSDGAFISHQASISGVYRDIATSLPASDTYYTAPADGYFVFVMRLAANTYFAIFRNTSNSVADLLDIANSALAQNYVIRVPIARGGIIRIQYSGTPTFRAARFYYAQGSI